MNTEWKERLLEVAQSNRITKLKRFFKTGNGDYAEGDIFIGLTVPENRKISSKFHNLPLTDINEMLDERYHEFRLAALLALVEKYRRSNEQTKTEIAEFYIANCHKANNWDLVDLSAPYILGEEIVQGKLINEHDKLVRSGNLWEQRVSIVSTLTLIRSGDLSLPIITAKHFLVNSHPLIQKATGWILREVGKKNPQLLREFLYSNIGDISAITLSYAIERFPRDEREEYRKNRKTATNSHK